MEGKINLDNLNNLIKNQTGINQLGIILGSQIGGDAAAIDFNSAVQKTREFYEVQSEECFMVWKADPITFSTPNPGKYAIIVNANDLACLGALPYGVLVTWFLPKSTSTEEFDALQQDLHNTAIDFQISILGGHTEFTSAVNSIVISLTMIGFTPKGFFPSRKVKPGYLLYLIGFVGNEGTAILGHEVQNKKSLPKDIEEKLDSFKMFNNLLSISQIGLRINKILKPAMMHDGTEGGILGAIYEMFSDLNLGVSIEKDALSQQTHNLTKILCNWLNLNPLRLITSGTLLLCVANEIPESMLSFINHPIGKIAVVLEKKEFKIGNLQFGPSKSDEIIRGLKILSTMN